MAASTSLDGGKGLFVANFNSAAVLNDIVAQAVGKDALKSIDTSNFTSVATTALDIRSDRLLYAISQVLSKTIFSVRPYSRKFKGLYQDNVAFGNHVRKLNIADSDFDNDLRYDLFDLPEGATSVDQQIVKKPNILQTNYYGQNIFTRMVTIFRDQLNIAFSNEAEFQRFITMIMTNASDQIEQAHESVARMTLVNLIAGKKAGDAGNVINLLTEYNTATGSTLTAADVYKPANFVPFVKWAFARIKTVSDFMTERSQKYHVNVTGKEISRHTPYRMQGFYMLSQFMNEVSTMVLSDIFHDDRLKLMDYERVGFWQSIDSPDSITVKPAYIDATGTVKTSSTDVAMSGVIGVLFDKEACGVTTINQWSAPSPFNARGGYSNIFWHFNDRYYNDFTENAVVFVIEDAGK